jgi:hypothetical protein
MASHRIDGSVCRIDFVGVSPGVFWKSIREKEIYFNLLNDKQMSLLRYHHYFKFRGFQRLALIEAAQPIEPHSLVPFAPPA